MLKIPFLDKLDTNALALRLFELRLALSLMTRLKLMFLKGDSSPTIDKKASLLIPLRRYEEALSCLRTLTHRVQDSKNKSDRHKRKEIAEIHERMFRIVLRQEEDAKSFLHFRQFKKAELAFSDALALLGYVPLDTGLAEQVALKRKRLLDNFVYSLFHQAREAERRAELTQAADLYERSIALMKEDSIHWLEIHDAYTAFTRKCPRDAATPAHEPNVDTLLADVDYEAEDFFLTPDLADFELELIRFYAASAEFDKAIAALEKLNVSALSDAALRTTPTPASSYESTILFVADKMLTHAVSLPPPRLDEKIRDLEQSLKLFKLVSSPIEFVELELAELYVQTGDPEDESKAKAIFSRLRDKWEEELELRSAAGETSLGSITRLCKNLARVSRQLKLLGEEIDETGYWETYARAKRRVFERFVKARQEDDTLEFYRAVERQRLIDEEDEEEEAITQDWEETPA